MIRTRTLFIVSGLALALGATASTAAPNSNARPAGAPIIAHPPKKTVPVQHVAQYTITDLNDTASTSLAPGFNTVETVKIRCDGPGACTLGIESMVQAISATDANTWAIAFMVDGTYIPASPFLGQLNSGYYTVNNARFSTTIAKGTHTITAQIDVNSDATLSDWQNDYTLYRP